MAVVSWAEIAQFRSVLDYVNSLTQQQVVNLWRALEDAGMVSGPLFVDTLADGLTKILTENRAAAVDAASVFYAETQAVPMVAAHIEAAKTFNRATIRDSVLWALRADGDAALGRIAGFAQRHVYGGARDYATSAIGDTYSGGWYRAAQPGACEFCQLLATRALYDWGPYESAKAALTVGAGKHSHKSSRDGLSYHDFCRCLPIKADMFEPNDDLESWGATYRATRLAAESDGAEIFGKDGTNTTLKYWRQVKSGKWDVKKSASGDVIGVERIPDDK